MIRRLVCVTWLGMGLLGIAGSASASPAGTLDLDALWPATDGLAWRYAQRTEILRPTPSTTDRVVRMIFDGTAVAPDDIAVQVLTGDVVSGPVASANVGPGADDPFLRTLAIARPDLAPALAATAALAPCPTQAIPGFDAVLLGPGIAWRKDATEIASWRCNLANTRAWTWLVANLAIGHTFDLQLVPDLASDIYLHGTNAVIEDVTVTAGTFTGCLRVDYEVDYGLATCTDTEGQPVGTYRSVTRGSVHWAEGVGPVKSTEEFVPYLEVTGTCTPPIEIGRPSSRVTMELVAQPVSARASTWGALKTRYR